MADAVKTNEVVQRHEIADYLNIGTTAEKKFALMGVGFTSLGESPNAQTSTKKYINAKSSTTTIKSYQPQFAFEADQIKDDEAIDFIYNIGRNELTGASAETEYVRVELWNPVTGSENTFTARMFRVSIEVSGMDGEDDQTISGNLNGKGDFVDGTFNTTTKTFTETAAEA